MRIAIDYTPAINQGAGIGRYTRCLVEALAEVDTENEYVLFYTYAGHKKPSWPFADQPNFVEKAASVSDRTLSVLWFRLGLPLPINLLIGDAALYHATDFVLPPLRRTAGIVTVHDLSFILFPDHAESGLVSYLERAVPASVERARLVLADSENTRNDIVCLLDAEPGKVEVLYAGVERRFTVIDDEERLAGFRGHHNLVAPFILSVGTIERRKNLARLIRAYGLLRSRNRVDHKLVIAGKPGWLYADVFEAVSDLHLEEDVIFLGYVPDEDLPALYNLADLFVYPSLYEGFGLPPLEAMACGTPVVASDNSSLPEVLGDAYLSAAPTDTEALGHAIERGLADADLRRRLHERGIERAARFSWEASARRLLDLYRQMGG
ncbi:MAG: glycosyltransferase family 1 protein [Dehalococcoidales bacterium]|nr:glycosyltransferase family 1 protein [Dehalococcoidales bacterium]